MEYIVEQRSPEWFNLRIGKFTASTFKNLFAGSNTQTYKNEIYRVVFERLTKKSPENVVTEYMQRGTELEPEARSVYELETGNNVKEPGFFELNEWIGASPDGLIREDGLIEIKCPKYSTMIEYMIKNKVPSEYIWQIQGQLWVTERKWCDFVAYHPDLPILIIRVLRDENKIKELELAVNQAISEVKKILETISV